MQVLRSSREAEEATSRAWDVERFYLDEDDPDLKDCEEEKEVAIVRYRHSLTRLKAAFPSLCPGWQGEVQPAGEQNSVQCVAACGGRLGAWPWTVQTGPLGFCMCDVLHKLRGSWGDAYYWKRMRRVCPMRVTGFTGLGGRTSFACVRRQMVLLSSVWVGYKSRAPFTPPGHVFTVNIGP